MGQIFLEGVEPPAGSAKLYLVYRDDSGVEYVIRGGKQSGQLVMYTGGLLQDSVDARGGDTPADRGSKLVKLSGGIDEEDAWAIMNKFAETIEDQGLLYSNFLPGRFNANAAITTLLRFIGVDPDPLVASVSSNFARTFFKTSKNIAFDFELRGTLYDDVMVGRGGDQILHGLEGRDRMKGGSGSDTLYGDAGPDILFGGTGNDYLDGGDDWDELWGEGGNDHLSAGSGLDVLRGGRGSDTLIAGEGFDKLYGDAGNDLLEAEADGHADRLRGGAGDDTLKGDEDDELRGENGRDLLIAGDLGCTLEGGRGADTLRGGAGNDQLIGEEGHDLLRGGEGFDVLYGGKGRDTLFGGKGVDVFNFLPGDGYNIIKDFRKGTNSSPFSDETINIFSQGTLGDQGFDGLVFSSHKKGAQVTFADVTIVVQGFSPEQLANEDFFNIF